MNGQQKESFIRDVYHPYHQDVYHYCLYFVNNVEDAQDLTQDIFVKALKSISTFKGDSSVRTWIMSIAKNTTVDFYRKKKIRRLLPFKWSNERSIFVPSPEFHVERNVEWKVIQEALNSLKNDYRQVIILRGLKEFSTKETAEILGWSESKVKVNYHRAMKKISSYISTDEEGVVMYEKSK